MSLLKIILTSSAAVGAGGVPKSQPSSEDFEFTASMAFRYAGYEPRFTGSMGDFGTYGGNNFLIQQGMNLTGSMGVRAA